MEDLNTSVPLFKKMDKAVFEQINRFKTTPNYTVLQDFYNGLEEEQQKIFKGLIILLLALIPAGFLGILAWQNSQMHADYEMRESILKKAQEIIGQNRGIRDVGPNILSQNPIDSDSMMTSRLSNLLSASGVDLAKIQVSDFRSDMISSTIMRSESDFSFNNVSTDELMNIFTNMIQREKFRIESVNITRNPDSNLLVGQFHAIHFSLVSADSEEE